MIKIDKLRESDKRRVVFYEPGYFDGLEAGQIKSWNDNFIFVQYFLRYENGKRFIKTCGETATATSPEDLSFAFDWETQEGKQEVKKND